MPVQAVSKGLDKLLKPVTDYRKYRFVQLQNGLRAVLVSDLKENEEPSPVLLSAQSKDSTSDSASESEEGSSSSEGGEECKDDPGNEEESEDETSSMEKQKAAAALCVGVGSFSDPLECQGLAHYLEHMVFMGSKKYPSENDFDAYVSQRGGGTNAYTTDKRTVFYFSVRPHHLEESLDRFANFFIAPLLNPDSMDREMTAVHSEYEMMKTSDVARREGLIQTLSKEGCPYRIFTAGSKKSLYEVPKSKNINIYSFLQSLRQRMYSAHLMTVAIIAKDTLDNLETLVSKVFADIPNSGSEAPKFSAYHLPFDTNAFRKLYKVNPIKDVNSLCISWSLPSHYLEYKSYPKELFGYLLGHEGPGSIISLLRKQHLAVDLCAGCQPSDTHSSNEMQEFLEVEIKLTDTGLKEYKKVVTTVFQYINMLRAKGVPLEVFEERKQLRENGFKFKAVSSPTDAVQYLAEALQYVGDLDWLLAAFSLSPSFPKEAFNNVLSLLRAEKANYCLSSKQFASKCDKVEENYGCQYGVEDIPKETYEAWNAAAPTSDLHLPAKNIFLPKNLDVLPVEDKLTGLPVELTKSLPRYGPKYGHLYYKMDKHFRIPKAFVKAVLSSPESVSSKKNQALHQLLIYAINQNVVDIAYFATEASFSYNISGLRYLEVQVYGFSDTLFVLYETLLKYIHGFTIKDDQFEAYKAIFRQKYASALHKPHDLVRGLTHALLISDRHLDHTMLPVLQQLTVEDLRNYHRQFLSRLRVSVYVHGNVTEENAKRYFLHLVDVIKCEPLPSIVMPQVRTMPVGDVRLRVYNFNEEDVNTALLNHYQLGPVSVFESCVLKLLCSVLGEPAFNFLRTKELLGYSVGIYANIMFGIASVCVVVLSQTDKFSLDHCFDKMLHFVTSMAKETIGKLSSSAFDDYVDAAIAHRRKEDTDMTGEAERNVTEIMSEEFLFDRREREIAALEKVTQEDLKAMLERILAANSCKHLSIQVESRKSSCASSPKHKTTEWEMHLESCCPASAKGSKMCSWLEDISHCYKWQLYPQHKVVK